MTLLRGHARALALDDAVELLFKGYRDNKPAQLMAEEACLRFADTLGMAGLETATDLAYFRYEKQFGHEPPQVTAAAESAPPGRRGSSLREIGSALKGLAAGNGG